LAYDLDLAHSAAENQPEEPGRANWLTCNATTVNFVVKGKGFYHNL